MSKVSYDDVMSFLKDSDNIKEQAMVEIEKDNFDLAVKKKKEELLTKKPLLQKIFPYKIEVKKL